MPIPFSIPVDSMGVLDHWETEIDRHPRHADTRLAYAAALNNADDPAGAVEQSSQALAQAPKMREAARLLASLLRRYEINPKGWKPHSLLTMSIGRPCRSRQSGI